MSAEQTVAANAAAIEQKEDSQVEESTSQAGEGDKKPDQEATADTRVDRDQKGRFRNSAQDRIDERTRELREAEREAAYWRHRATSGQQEPAEKPNPKPTPDKFDDYGAYVEALTDWKADQKANEVIDKRERERAEKAVTEKRASSFQERQEQIRKDLPDYDEVMQASDVPVAKHVTEMILESELGPQLAYHFAKNPDLADRLNGMTEKQAAREIGRLEVQLEKSTPRTATPDSKTESADDETRTRTDAAPTPAPASRLRQTAAPAPIKPVGQGQSALKDPSRMSMEEYRTWRKSQGATWAR